LSHGAVSLAPYLQGQVCSKVGLMQMHGSARTAAKVACDLPTPFLNRTHQLRARAATSAEKRQRIRRMTRMTTYDAGPFVPLLLGGIALLMSFAYQTYQLWVEGSALQAAHASQQQTVDNAARLRASLDAIAADTQRLADSGNANARLLVEELRRRGITINAAASAQAPTKP
ncbi:MAG: hypothetical protein J0H09_25695, partial [Burkholderiales bacterium]|nr:hypothetical protein [Burkholderiales bacterium]